jgi:UDP-glucuronate 4-epimerase
MLVENVFAVHSEPLRLRLVEKDATSLEPSNSAPYRLYNIGNHQPVELMKLIEILEKCLGKTALKHMLPMQPGDVPSTFADVDDLMHDTGFRPATPIETGVERFIRWYQSYYLPAETDSL